MKLSWLLAFLTVILLGCSSNAELTRSSYDADFLSSYFNEASASVCQGLFSEDPEDNFEAINAETFQLLSWNVKKGESDTWLRELAYLASGKQLVLMQEALDTMQHKTIFRDNGHWAFAEGYESTAGKTGVASFSPVDPVGQCELQAHEPWLGTPKASVITRYAISRYNETLVVVNTHMINFTIGTSDYQKQLMAIVNAVESHQGPLIISGDFNTWNQRRLDQLNVAMASLKMTPVTYQIDNRSRFFGLPVDHTFVRGFSVQEAKTHLSESSDHNPMTFSLNLVGTNK